MKTQEQATKYALNLLAYNKPSLSRTVVTSTAYVAIILFLSGVVGAAMENTGSEVTKSAAYLAAIALGFILFFSVKLINGIVKYLRNRR